MARILINNEVYEVTKPELDELLCLSKEADTLNPHDFDFGASRAKVFHCLDKITSTRKPVEVFKHSFAI